MFPFQQNISPESSEASSSPDPLPWQTVSEAQDAQRRLDAMEQAEPKRRLIRDAKALTKLRQITQVQMAEEMSVPHRTLEDWLQAPRHDPTAAVERATQKR